MGILDKTRNSPGGPHLKASERRCDGECLDVPRTDAQYTFAQPFLWPTRPIPEAMAYRPPDTFLSDLEDLSRRSIEWACGAGAFYLDIWSMLIHPFSESFRYGLAQR